MAAAYVAAHGQVHPMQEFHMGHDLHGLLTSTSEGHHDHVPHHEEKPPPRRIAIREERRPSLDSRFSDDRAEEQNGKAVDDLQDHNYASEHYASESMSVTSVTSLPMGNSKLSISAEDWEMIMRSSGLANAEHMQKKIWIDGDRFQFFVGTVICLNVIVIGLETDLSDQTAGFKEMTPWKMVECLFCLIWVSEASLRMYFEQWHYFLSGWNVLDIILVASSLLELFILPYIIGKEFLPAFFRAVRILRLLRLMRLVRLVPVFKGLWLIICGFVEALKTLGWVLLLLVIVIYSGGIYMTILVGQQCEEKFDFWSDCEDIWGSVPSSMYSLFQVLTLESWSMLIARPVLKKKPYLVTFFLGFLMLTTFGLLNIIVGVIVENTLKASNDEMHRAMMERDAKMRVELLGLKQLFEEADEDNNGNVDADEFRTIFENPDVQQRLKSLDIPCASPDSLFEMLDEDGGGSVSIFEFIEGVSRLKSPPKASDLRSAAHQVHNTSHTVNKMKVTISQMARALGMDDVATTAEKKRGGLGRQQSPPRRNKRLMTVASNSSSVASTQCESPNARSLQNWQDNNVSRQSSPAVDRDSPNLERRLLCEDGTKRHRSVPNPAVHDPANLILIESDVLVNARACNPNSAPVWDHPKTLASHSAERGRLEGIEWSVGQRLQRLERIAHNLVRSQDRVRHAVNEVLIRIPQAVPTSAPASGTST